MAILNNNKTNEVIDFDDVAKAYDEYSAQVAADDGKYAYLAEKRSKKVLAANAVADEVIPAAKAGRAMGVLLGQGTTASRAFITRNDHYTVQDIQTKIVNCPEYKPIVFNYGEHLNSAHSELVTECPGFGGQFICRVSDDGSTMLEEGTDANSLREDINTCLERLGETQEAEKAACEAKHRKSVKLAAYVLRVDIPDPTNLAGMRGSDSEIPYSTLSILASNAIRDYMEVPHNASLKPYGISYFAMYYKKGKLHQIVLVVIPREYHPEGIDNVTLVESNYDRYRSKKTGGWCNPDDEGAYLFYHKGDAIVSLPHSYFTRANRSLKYTPAQFCYRTTKTKLMMADLYALMAGGNSGHYTIGRLDANPLRGNKIAFKTCMTYNNKAFVPAEAKVNQFFTNVAAALGLKKASEETDKLVIRIRQAQADWGDNFSDVFASKADFISEDTMFCFDGDTPDHIQAITGCIEKVWKMLDGMITSAAAALNVQLA
ncbi:MAG: hypothetical protein PUF17_07295 [Lactimicrobium massiliense]|nr:hypothetical protein [Lactimicrobium massiliense]MDD6560760.1 hypothetical protein [Lactimicrobium massiliense]